MNFILTGKASDLSQTSLIENEANNNYIISTHQY